MWKEGRGGRRTWTLVLFPTCGSHHPSPSICGPSFSTGLRHNRRMVLTLDNRIEIDFQSSFCWLHLPKSYFEKEIKKKKKRKTNIFFFLCRDDWKRNFKDKRVGNNVCFHSHYWKRTRKHTKLKCVSDFQKINNVKKIFGCLSKVSEHGVGWGNEKQIERGSIKRDQAWWIHPGSREVGTECGYVHTMVSNQCLRLLCSCCATQVVVCFYIFSYGLCSLIRVNVIDYHFHSLQ